VRVHGTTHQRPIDVNTAPYFPISAEVIFPTRL
jgi:hypothetical protein